MGGKLAILLGALALALPGAAQAATFCVNAPGCAPENERATLGAALLATDAAPGPDRIDVGPGLYEGPFSADEDNAVEIVGAGRGTTVLTALGDATVISLAAPASGLRGLTVRAGAGTGVRLMSAGPPAVLENMTVELTAAGTGVQVGPGSAAPVSATLRHVTLAGGRAGTGLDVAASGASAATATLTSSVITRFEVPIRATPPLATVTTDYSAYDTGSVPAPGVTATNGPVTGDPKLDEELRPRFDSPLIDAANPVDAGASDASGAPRVIDGDGKDGARSDIGALEYQRRAPVISAVTATPAVALPSVPIAFHGAATDPDGEDVTAEWSFGDGGPATGFDVTRGFGMPGPVTARLTVTDVAGVTATASVDVTIESPPPPATPVPPDPPAPGPRARVTARVFPEGLVLRAVARRDRKAPYRFKLRGRLVLPDGISTAGCSDGVVRLAVRAGKRRLSPSAKLAADCSFRLTLKLGRRKARRVVVTPQFAGTAALAPREGSALRLRAG